MGIRINRGDQKEDGVRIGSARAPGACSVINSYSTGQGVAFAIGLGQTVTVLLKPISSGDTRIRIASSYSSDKGTRLVEMCFRKTTGLTSAYRSFDAKIDIDFDLPIERGLKSSSSLANATVMATSDALGLDLGTNHIMAIARSAEIDTGVSTFGSVDDGFASLCGGLVFADCGSRRLLHRENLDDSGLDVIILAPPKETRQVPTGSREALKVHKHLIEKLYRIAATGHVFTAMTLSGLLHAPHFGYSSEPVFEALRVGALGAGVSGKGPAIAAVVAKANTPSIVNTWRKYGHEIMVTNIDNSGTKILCAESTKYKEAI
ncbi:MAG: shikimate kinase [Proteobacteria bacterium]|nr:shikimate kinase [Pseudomonadota bacterium]